MTDPESAARRALDLVGGPAVVPAIPTHTGGDYPMTDNLPDRLAGFFTPPYDDAKRLRWDLSRDGTRRLAVSEGRMLLAVIVPDDGTGHWLPTPNVDPPPDPWPLLDAPPAEAVRPLAVPVAALLEWCGSEPAAGEVECSTCGGDGECECSHCDTVHDCGQCRGTGRAVELRDPLHGRLLGLRVDRHRLRRLLSAASGQCVATARRRADDRRGPIDFLRVDGDGWTAMLMPMEDDASVPCPAFEEVTADVPALRAEIARLQRQVEGPSERAEKAAEGEGEERDDDRG